MTKWLEFFKPIAKRKLITFELIVSEERVSITTLHIEEITVETTVGRI